MQYRNKTIKTGQYSNEVIKMSKNIQNVNDLINSNVHAKEYYLKLSEAARGNVNLDIRSLEELKTFSENIK